MMLKSGLVLSCLAALVTIGRGQTCTKVGFCRNPNDCTKFYRCVDLWQLHHFNCPPGLVFDENISTCNWPYQAAPCKNGPAVGGGAATGGGGGDSSNGVTPGESQYLNANWL